MFSISALSPPSTPRGSIFSPRQSEAPWSMHALSLESPGKRVKLNPVPSTFSKPSFPRNNNKNMFIRSATLASRRLKNAPTSIAPLQMSSARVEPETQSLSTGLSPIVKSLSIMSKASKPSGLQIESRQQSPAACESTPSPSLTFRLQKSTPAKIAQAKGVAVPRLSLAIPTGLISPPSANSTPKRRPPPLSFGSLASPATNKSMSPSLPQTPGTAGFASFSPPNIMEDLMFGEASPSFYAQKTPPPASWVPTFFVTPPTPVAADSCAGSQSGSVEAKLGSGACTLSPSTPPWPKSGSGLQKTIFDHIGKNQLSTMDLRGYMAISMSS
ncbi:hypothetical protein BX661DRAFT_214255 [Kickxella alabastrina]|uniref:uncharacterized protein n=1 Tax=Kickxella alabastrina TaxID=61397 RepID=UPI00222019BE|nr:uncharacterized protein BX661DRAFT_214255 [Kickxella alabastrina]KAI7825933.1 hypothetical protein BX661DRAFT_214255 [Kickxella alabastrina]KAJ1947177.1 hypothetical protein GGF37_000632 [Kickxella alabastrina]